jgi:hypothetical protein
MVRAGSGKVVAKLLFPTLTGEERWEDWKIGKARATPCRDNCSVMYAAMIWVQCGLGWDGGAARAMLFRSASGG